MNKQDYKKIEYASKVTHTFKNREIVIYQLKNYKNVYISNTCHIKPKGLHIILKNINEAIKEFDIIGEKNKIIITSHKDGFNSLGMYDAINNEICLNEIVLDKNKLSHENIESGHVERHEVWHLKQATIYRKKYGTINNDNYQHYLNYTNSQAKKFLDSMGVNEDNVIAISKYAYYVFAYKNYGEVEAEIKAKKGAICILQNSRKKSKN